MLPPTHERLPHSQFLELHYIWKNAGREWTGQKKRVREEEEEGLQVRRDTSHDR